MLKFYKALPFKCPSCASIMIHKVGTYHLECQNCKSTKAIDLDNSFKPKYPLDNYEKRDLIIPTPKVIDCLGCGADIEFGDDEISKNCSYCNTPLVTQAQNTIKPSKIIPFYIDTDEGKKIFKKWIGSLWFAPNDIKKLLHYERRFKATYLPFFSYDSHTTTAYTGERGDIYYVKVTKRVYIDGKEQYVTQMEPRIRWSYVSNTISRDFKDITVNAKREVSSTVKKIAKFDLNTLVNFNPSFLSGYESYEFSIEMKECYAEAKEYMSNIIYKDVLWDIGGDQQRVSTINSQYKNRKFDLYMMPIWITEFKYNRKNYSIAINGATGEIEGERPYSYIKIILFAAIILVTIFLSLFLYNKYYNNSSFDLKNYTLPTSYDFK